MRIVFNDFVALPENQVPRLQSFALTVLDLLKFGTIRAVAAYLGVGWDMVKEIHKDRLSLSLIP